MAHKVLVFSLFFLLSSLSTQLFILDVSLKLLKAFVISKSCVCNVVLCS
jgi:hypothetical protein